MSFPNTSVLDALQSGSVSGNWTTPSLNQPTTGVESASGASTVGGSTSGFYWNPTTFTADQEAYLTWNGVLASNVITLNLRITNPGGATAPNLNCYQMNFGADGAGAVFKIVNGTATSVRGFGHGVVSVGDSIGLSAIGTTITMYYKTAAGAWGPFDSFTDSAVSGAGYIGFVVQNSFNKAINFGGGSVGGAVANSGFLPLL